MTKALIAAALCVSVALPAYAQVAAGSTGGPSGGPNQAQSVVPTGGRSGGPNQAQHVKSSKKKHKKHH